MKAKTEILLYHLLWTAENLTRPHYRLIEDSFEGWAYRNGLSRQLHRLEHQAFIESRRSPAAKRIYRLTEKGRICALGGRDPEAHWNLPWDGIWRLVSYDLPVLENAARDHLRRLLRIEHYGMIQKSVWISPRHLSEQMRSLCGKGDEVNTILSLEARPGADERNSRIVARAWNFKEINERYSAHQSILRKLPRASRKPTPGEHWKRLEKWSIAEWEAWSRAITSDPLLPRELHPRGYLGVRSWERRKRILTRVAASTAEK